MQITRPLAGAAGALALLLTCATQAAPPASPPPASPLLPALQRDLGLDGPRLARYRALERRAPAAAQAARQALGDRYAGAWLERDAAGEFHLALAATGHPPGARVAGVDGDLRSATYSLRQLQAAFEALRQLATTPHLRAGLRPDPALHAWYVDVRSNRIVLETDRGDAARRIAAAFVAAAGVDPAMVRIVPVDGRPATTSRIGQTTLRGGDGYANEAMLCSAGFAAHWMNDIGFVTAGHCGRTGMDVFGLDGNTMGLMQKTAFPGTDYASVRITNTRQWSVIGLVRTDARDLRVAGNMEVPDGGVVCRYGMTSQFHCGVIRNRNVEVNYPGGTVSGLTEAEVCSDPGDSGGPVYSQDGEAQGVVSGNSTTSGWSCKTVFATTYYQPIVPALGGLDMTLTTYRGCGRMNPGDVLTPGAAIISCDGRVRLTQQGDGNLVLYKVVDGVSTPLWWNGASGTDFTTVLQGDGNLVTYDAAMNVQWHTRTSGRPGATLFVQDDGNTVIYNPQWLALWHTRTNGR